MEMHGGPSGEASFVGDMKSFPIEYVTRHAPLTCVRGVHTRARTTDKHEKHGQRFEEEERDANFFVLYFFVTACSLSYAEQIASKVGRNLQAILANISSSCFVRRYTKRAAVYPGIHRREIIVNFHFDAPSAAKDQRQLQRDRNLVDARALNYSDTE